MGEVARWKPGPITWIVLGLLLWGGYLAIGSYTSGQSLHWQKGLIIFGVTVVFVAFWLIMLAARKRRLARRRTAKTVGCISAVQCTMSRGRCIALC